MPGVMVFTRINTYVFSGFYLCLRCRNHGSDHLEWWGELDEVSLCQNGKQEENDGFISNAILAIFFTMGEFFRVLGEMFRLESLVICLESL